jgi:predicted outer membrane repeat protein
MRPVFEVYGDAAFISEWPGIQLAPLRVDGSSFTVELRGYSDDTIRATTTADGFYGFKLYVAPIMAVSGKPTVFQYNAAEEGRGGGLHMAFHVSFTVMTNVQFISNGASGGGAISMLSAITGTTMLGLLFDFNGASGNGGALLVESGASGIYIANTVFKRSSSSQDGGAVAFVVSNGQLGTVQSNGEGRVTITDSQFQDNEARRGGAVFADDNNGLRLMNCTLAGNAAKVSGGGLHFEADNIVDLTSLTIENNEAKGHGGGLALGPGNEVWLDACDFERNSAGKQSNAVG